MTLMCNDQLSQSQKVTMPALCKRHSSPATDTCCPASPPSFPGEVWDLIFRFYISPQTLRENSHMSSHQVCEEDLPSPGRSRKDENGLYACALVCKVWAANAVPILYGHPIVTYDKISSFLRSLSSSSKLASHIRHLTIYPSPRHPEERVEDGKQQIHKNFTQVFDHLPILQSLVIREAKVLNLVDADRLFVGLKKTAPVKARLELNSVFGDEVMTGWLEASVPGYTLGEVAQNAKAPGADDAAVSNADLAEPMPPVLPSRLAHMVQPRFRRQADQIAKGYWNAATSVQTSALMQALYRTSQEASYGHQRTSCTFVDPTTTLRWHFTTMLEIWKARLVALSLVLDGVLASKMVVERKVFATFRAPHIRLRLQAYKDSKTLFHAILNNNIQTFIQRLRHSEQKPVDTGILHDDVQLFELEVDAFDLTEEMMLDEAVKMPSQLCRMLKGTRPWADVRTEPSHSSSSDNRQEDANDIPDYDIYCDDDDYGYESDASTESNRNPFYED